MDNGSYCFPFLSPLLLNIKHGNNQMSSIESEHSQYDVLANNDVSEYLTRHVPKQLVSPRQTCYRHRTDIARMPVPEELSRASAQKVYITYEIMYHYSINAHTLHLSSSNWKNYQRMTRTLSHTYGLSFLLLQQTKGY